MTTIQQLSVFLENKEGKLLEVLQLIGNDGINIVASTVSDTSGFGLFRLIANDTWRAFQILKENNIGAYLSPVIALEVEASSGSLAEKVRCFTEAGLSIQYMYSVAMGNKAFIIIKFDDNDKAEQLMDEKGYSTFTVDELCNL